MRLTNTKIGALKANGLGQQFYWDRTAQGFGVRVSPRGVKSYIAQGRVNGKTRRVTIARCEQLNCDDARKRAYQIVLDMQDGIDYREEKQRKQAQQVTLRAIVEDYIENTRTKNGELRARSKQNCRSNMENVFCEWLDRPIVDISLSECAGKFRAYTKKAPIQANQAFRNLRAVINYCRESYRAADGSYPVLAVNPVSQLFGRGGLLKWNPVQPRTTRIPKHKIGEVIRLLNELSDSDGHTESTHIAADIVKFSLYTGGRKSEVCQLQWQNVDLNSPIKTFRFRNTKNHNDLVQPISSPLLAVLKKREERRANDYVFPSVRGATPYMADARSVLRKASVVVGEHIHPHCLRRSYDDVAQYCGVDADQRRQLLNHMASDVHGMAYSNNPDPALLVDAVERIGQWYRQQGEKAEYLQNGKNIILLVS